MSENENSSNNIEESEEQSSAASEGNVDDLTETAVGLLKASRLEQGYTVEWVAEELRVPLQYIEHIERGDFARFRDKAILRGYVRNYARLLELEPEALVALFESEVAVDTVVREPHELHGKNRAAGDVINRHAGLLIFLGAVLLAAVVGIAIWLAKGTAVIDFFDRAVAEEPLENSDDSDAVPDVDEDVPDFSPNRIPVEVTRSLDVPTAVPESVDEFIVEEEMPDAPSFFDTTTDLGDPVNIGQPNVDFATTPASSVDSLPGTRATDGRDLESVSEDDQQVPASIEDEPAIPSALEVEPDTTLNFNFTDASWVEVVDNSGQTLFMGIKSEGEELEVDGEPPYNVKIGFARGVTMKYGGKDRPIPSGADRSAEFVVGE